VLPSHRTERRAREMTRGFRVPVARGSGV
jgi:hypothetical protein